MYLILAILLCLSGWYLYERSQRRTHPVTPGLHEEIDLPHTQEWEIYQNSLSICSKKLRVCMEELALPHLSHHVHLIETKCYENLSRDFLKVNPGFTVPVLVHRGHPVYESHEQILYAAEHAGTRGAELLGESRELRAEVARWVDHGALKGDPLAGGEERAGTNAPGLTVPIFATMIPYIPWWRLGEGLLFHGDRRRPLVFSILKLRGIRKLPEPALVEIRKLGRTMKQRAADILAFFDRPGTSNGPTEAINGRLEHLRGSALGFRNLTHYIARSLLEAGGFRPALHPRS